MSLFPRGIPITKRLFDLALVVLTLPISLPLMVLVGALVWAAHGWPVLFCQARPGYRGALFRLCKFRTMNNRRGPDGALLPDAERLTRLGRLLRATSLDELPELLLVLAGKMSLVGPRPLLPQYLARYSPEQARRHAALPGITGWAQVNGRNALSWPERFALDVWYVDHWSLGLDVRILLMTVGKVLRREGISQPGQATAEEFMGNPE